LKFLFEGEIAELLASFEREKKFFLKIKSRRVDSRFCLKEIILLAEKRLRKIQQKFLLRKTTTLSDLSRAGSLELN